MTQSHSGMHGAPKPQAPEIGRTQGRPGFALPRVTAVLACRLEVVAILQVLRLRRSTRRGFSLH